MIFVFKGPRVLFKKVLNNNSREIIGTIIIKVYLSGEYFQLGIKMVSWRRKGPIYTVPTLHSPQKNDMMPV